MSNKTIFLDTALKTGYCIYDHNNQKITDIGNIKLSEKESERDLNIQLDELITKNGITKIVAEDIYHGNEIAFKKLAGYQGIINLTAQQHSLPAIFLENLRAKRYLWRLHGATDKLNEKAMSITKRQIINKVRSYGYTPATEDEADSLMIAIFYLEFNGYPIIHPNQK